ncbi:MAG: polyamine aminopropyltransferase [Bacteroidales bacterium]|nr:polyamine aminopropyltransferase [Bacteroidales bacterium]
MKNIKSNILKIALFATGLSGIVAEYILSTLATYFLGDSVFQWTMIVSVMMFSMGLGSQLSKYFRKNLLQVFIFIEFTLSVLVSFSSLLAYTISSYSNYTGFLIYFLSILIGLLIGLEIPIVIRLNKEFESLRVNISKVMAMDYFGSLAGGMFFAFIGLPYLGLTYTPFVLGFVNFAVAIILTIILWENIKTTSRKAISISGIGIILLIVSGSILAKPVILFGEQRKYKDKVVYTEQSKYQRIVLTQWKNDFWLYINGNQQLSTKDEVMYHEPLVHPAMKLLKQPKEILIMGGGDGCVARELLKYSSIEKITLVDLDPAITDLSKTHPVLSQLNENSLLDPKVMVINEDGFKFLDQTEAYYDAIIIDLPDPKTVELSRLYSYEFYMHCYRQLRPHGVVVTQAGSPYYAARAFKCIDLTMSEAGFTTIPLHNQVLTLGEWGFVLGVKNVEKEEIIKRLKSLHFNDIETQWINNDAMQLITSFGKDIFDKDEAAVEVNRIHNPVLYHYYLKGDWDLY